MACSFFDLAKTSSTLTPSRQVTTFIFVFEPIEQLPSYVKLATHGGQFVLCDPSTRHQVQRGCIDCCQCVPQQDWIVQLFPLCQQTAREGQCLLLTTQQTLGKILTLYLYLLSAAKLGVV
jgi:hypothetical protein